MIPVTTLAELQKHDQEEVLLRGRYQRINPFPAGKKKKKKGHTDNTIVRIVLDEAGNGPMLGAYWMAESDRSVSEMEEFEGKMVEIIGVFHQEQPPQPGAPEHVATFGGPCIVEIKQIVLVEE